MQPETGTPAGGFFGFGICRSRSHRVLAGVAGGIAERLRVDPALIRVGLVALTLCGGTGLLVYAVAWAALPQAEGAPQGASAQGSQRGVAVALVLAGVLLLLRSAGLWLGDTLAWSVGLATLGLGVIWLQGDEAQRERWSRMAVQAPGTALAEMADGPVGKVRIATGALIMVAGVATFLARTNALQSQPAAVVAVAITALGAALVAGPWGWRLVRDLTEERRERIRSQERAGMAAHLHDSVLQTLALIQRSDQPREMVALARNQERELRAWLNGDTAALGGTAATVAAAVQAAAASVELQFKVPVEVVTVGDTPLDEGLTTIVEACREAAVNAAKHSGADRIAIYVEVEPRTVTAFVRDQGCGFDPALVPPDRRGIAESIRGRMHRCGGWAAIVSEPGGGTEVQLGLPRPQAAGG